jgi:hypothetical protein
MLRTLLSPLYRTLINIPGWKTKKKIVIFESDDWGSIRMPSLQVFKELTETGFDLSSKDFLRYNINDTLATSDDLNKLFEVLSSFTDSNKRPAVFTAVSVVANPDFQKIQDSEFTQYFYEPFTETLKNNKGCENSFNVWEEGIASNIFVPEFHGREHLNVKNWMNALSSNNQESLTAFNKGFWSYNPNQSTSKTGSFQAAFDLMEMGDLPFQEQIIEDGIELFKKIFKKSPLLFTPSNGIMSSKLEKTLHANGIKLINAAYIQNEPLGNDSYKRKFYYQGKKNNLEQIYITRNCTFEPSYNFSDSVTDCLYQIETAFKYHKPAIISSHRVNYIGNLNLKNRDNGLKYLTILLKSIKSKWPEVEFATTSDLISKYNAFKDE